VDQPSFNGSSGFNDEVCPATPMAPELSGIALRERLLCETFNRTSRRTQTSRCSCQTRNSPTANLGVDMPKARLHLIRCSDDIGSEAKRRRSDGRFQPSVIDGGKRAIAVPAGDPWQALLELFDLGLLVSRTNYLAFVMAGLAALEHHGWADLQTEQSDSR
jgi:hypothetical protein